MQSRLVLFDVDGTLIDSAGAGRRAMEAAFGEVFGIADVGRLAAGVRYSGMTDPVILAAISAAAGVPSDRYTASAERLRATYLRHLETVMASDEPRRRVLPGVRELLERLSAMPRVHLGLLTGNLEAGARLKLAPFGLLGYFTGGGFASDHADRHEIARLAWRKLCGACACEFPAERVVVVGDTEHDVACARANGFRAVAVASGWVERETLEAARPDALLDGLDDPRALAALGLDD